MLNPLLERPTPDFAELERILRGEEEPGRVHLVELGIDQEILEAISERFLGQAWVFPPASAARAFGVQVGEGENSFTQSEEPHLRRLVDMYHRLGYDCVSTWPIFTHHPPLAYRLRTDDTAEVPHEQRRWVDEHRGLISSWEDFERFPWDEIVADTGACQFVAQCLPAGMKIAAKAVLYEHVMENLLGYEGLFYLLHDDPKLVEQVFAHWGQKVYEYYEAVIGMDAVGAIFHADDLGFKTSTMLPPDALRKYVFPWFRQYAALAHAHGKTYWYHCCGNVYSSGVIEDLIDYVQIDALHSFQDVILPVADFRRRYGDRVAALGGADVDKMARMAGTGLREYVRGILDGCMPGGRFAMGSGNSVTNYVPVENYCLMLEECRRWQPSAERIY